MNISNISIWVKNNGAVSYQMNNKTRRLIQLITGIAPEKGKRLEKHIQDSRKISIDFPSVETEIKKLKSAISDSQHLINPAEEALSKAITRQKYRELVVLYEKIREFENHNLIVQNQVTSLASYIQASMVQANDQKLQERPITVLDKDEAEKMFKSMHKTKSVTNLGYIRFGNLRLKKRGLQ
jgi:hypothetical protein